MGCAFIVHRWTIESSSCQGENLSKDSCARLLCEFQFVVNTSFVSKV